MSLFFPPGNGSLQCKTPPHAPHPPATHIRQLSITACLACYCCRGLSDPVELPGARNAGVPGFVVVINHKLINACHLYTYIIRFTMPRTDGPSASGDPASCPSCDGDPAPEGPCNSCHMMESPATPFPRRSADQPVSLV